MPSVITWGRHMESNIKKFEEELKKLMKHGEYLLYSMALDFGAVDEKTEKELKKLKLPSFKYEYEWGLRLTHLSK